MPKPTRKQKEKAQDFKKVKLKLGRKVAKADNYTDTSFKSRSIALPSQSITADKSGELTNSRNLTLRDLLTQLRHYNGTVRKEALIGLKDLMQRDVYGSVLRTQLGGLIEGLVKCILDDERDVRKQVVTFFEEYLTPPSREELIRMRAANYSDDEDSDGEDEGDMDDNEEEGDEDEGYTISSADLMPFAPLIFAHASLAMTHIVEAVRATGLQMIDYLLRVAPQIAVANEERLLANYMSLFQTDTKVASSSPAPGMTGSTASGSSGHSTPSAGGTGHIRTHLWSQTSRVETLRSLHRFLAVVVSSDLGRASGSGSLDSRLAFISTSLDQRSPAHGVVEWPEDGTQLFRHSSALLGSAALISNDASGYNDEEDTEVTASVASPFDYLGLFSDQTGPSAASSALMNPAERRSNHSRQILSDLQPFLLATWLEAAPLVFGAAASVVREGPLLDTALLVLRVMGALTSNNVSSNPEFNRNQLQSIIPLCQQLMVYFPFGYTAYETSSAKAGEMLAEMNTIACRIIVEVTSNCSNATAEGAKLVIWRERANDFILSALGHTSEGNNSAMHLKSDQLVHIASVCWTLMTAAQSQIDDISKATAAELAAMHSAAASSKADSTRNGGGGGGDGDEDDDSIGGGGGGGGQSSFHLLLSAKSKKKKGSKQQQQQNNNQASANQPLTAAQVSRDMIAKHRRIQETMFSALLGYTSRCSSLSASKCLSIAIVQRMLMIFAQNSRTGNGIDVISHASQTTLMAMRAWLLTLPKLLWEIKNKAPETTGVILRLLTQLARWRLSALDSLVAQSNPAIITAISSATSVPDLLSRDSVSSNQLTTIAPGNDNMDIEREETADGDDDDNDDSDNEDGQFILIGRKSRHSHRHNNTSIDPSHSGTSSSQSRSATDYISPMAVELQINLVPFFHVHLASKGDIFGPFSGLSVEHQHMAIVFIYYCGIMIPKMQTAFTKAATEVFKTEDDEAVRLASIARDLFPQLTL